jgi:hypothetical protein
VTGPAKDRPAAELERAANDVYRFGKSVLRVTPERAAKSALAPALQETIPNLNANHAQALFCVETSCHPPIKDPAQLAIILTRADAVTVAAAGTATP